MQAKHGAVITCVTRDRSEKDAVAGRAKASAETRNEGQNATIQAGSGVGQGTDGRKRRRHFWEPSSDFEQEMQDMWAGGGGGRGRGRARGGKGHTTWRGLEMREAADDDQVRRSVRLVGYPQTPNPKPWTLDPEP